MFIRKLFERLWQWGKTSRFVAKVVDALHLGILWNVAGLTKRAAMYSSAATTSPQEFDKSGEQLAEKLREIAEPNQIVMDFGCGMGRVVKFLAPWCREVHGVDVASIRLRLAKKRCSGFDNVFFHKNNGRDLSKFRDAHFDFIFSVHALMHNEKEFAIFFIKEMHRILKPRGKVYLQFPNLLHPDNLNLFMEQSLGKHYHSPMRVRFWVPDEVEAIIKAVGSQCFRKYPTVHVKYGYDE